MTETGFDFGLMLAIAGVIVSVVGWEYKKMSTLKKEVSQLKENMVALHDDHKKLLAENSKEHTEVLRNLTDAINKMHAGIDELTHYIRWLGKTQTGREPPPKIGRSS